MKKNNIILIGFMGVGKGTVARAIFEHYGRFCIDTDDLIESVTKKKVKEIFKDMGEPYFRELEKQCAIWLENSISNTIISTGGGFYRQENIKNIGKVVYLKSSFEGILNRIHSSPNAKQKLAKRPLLKNFDEAKKLYEIRVEEYEKVCDVIVDVEARDIKEVIKELLSKCE
jgi:shikimate kinase